MSNIELSLLNKGLNFIPTVNRIFKDDIIDGVAKFKRAIILNEIFDNRIDNDGSPPTDGKDIPFPIKIPSDYNPNTKNRNTAENLENMEKITKVFLEDFTIKNNQQFVRSGDYKKNISIPELETLSDLSRNNQLIFKPSDKGNSLVILNRLSYINGVLLHLGDDKVYSRLDNGLKTQNIERITPFVNSLYAKKFINKKEHGCLLPKIDARDRIFYALPKIHKTKSCWPLPDVPPLRPIVSDINSEFHNITKYIDSFLIPLANKHFSYIKNTTDFLDKIVGEKVPRNAILASFDVTSLYTNMNINRTIAVVKRIFAKYQDKNRPDEILLQLLNYILHNVDFEFGGTYYQMTSGIGMGLSFSVSLANLYLIELDIKAIKGFNNIIPFLYFRFLDDIFSYFNNSVEEIHEFTEYLNSLIPGIHITASLSRTSIPFLDTEIYKFDVRDSSILLSKPHFKETATHYLLHKKSFHPKHTSIGVLKSQFLRIKRLSSTYTDYIFNVRLMSSVLKNLGYSTRILRDIKNKTWDPSKSNKKFLKNTENSTSLEDSEEFVEFVNKKNRKKILPIILPFSKISREIGTNLKKIVGNIKSTKKNRIVFAYKRNKNLRNFLVKAKININ